MSRKRKWKVGEIVRGFKPEISPEGTMWIPHGRKNEKGIIQAWRLVNTVNYEKDTDIPFTLPPEFDTPRKGTEGTQTTFLGKISGTEKKE